MGSLSLSERDAGRRAPRARIMAKRVAAMVRHRRKVDHAARLAAGADLVVYQETRGTQPDVASLSDRLPGWFFLGSFADDGSYGGVLFAVSPRICELYSDITVIEVVRGRIAILALRGVAGAPPLDVANVHLVSDGRTAATTALRLLRGSPSGPQGGDICRVGRLQLLVTRRGEI